LLTKSEPSSYRDDRPRLTQIMMADGLTNRVIIIAVIDRAGLCDVFAAGISSHTAELWAALCVMWGLASFDAPASAGALVVSISDNNCNRRDGSA
jgi:hypothetical protein